MLTPSSWLPFQQASLEEDFQLVVHSDPSSFLAYRVESSTSLPKALIALIIGYESATLKERKALALRISLQEEHKFVFLHSYLVESDDREIMICHSHLSSKTSPSPLFSKTPHYELAAVSLARRSIIPVAYLGQLLFDEEGRALTNGSSSHVDGRIATYSTPVSACRGPTSQGDQLYVEECSHVRRSGKNFRGFRHYAIPDDGTTYITRGFASEASLVNYYPHFDLKTRGLLGWSSQGIAFSSLSSNFQFRHVGGAALDNPIFFAIGISASHIASVNREGISIFPLSNSAAIPKAVHASKGWHVAGAAANSRHNHLFLLEEKEEPTQHELQASIFNFSNGGMEHVAILPLGILPPFKRGPRELRFAVTACSITLLDPSRHALECWSYALPEAAQATATKTATWSWGKGAFYTELVADDDTIILHSPAHGMVIL